jgi:hypothetical protein
MAFFLEESVFRRDLQQLGVSGDLQVDSSLVERIADTSEQRPQIDDRGMRLAVRVPYNRDQEHTDRPPRRGDILRSDTSSASVARSEYRAIVDLQATIDQCRGSGELIGGQPTIVRLLIQLPEDLRQPEELAELPRNRISWTMPPVS